VVSHKQTYSESLLLALFLSREYSAKVDLVSCDKLLKGVGHLVAEES
jgi:hypothetical protein